MNATYGWSKPAEMEVAERSLKGRRYLQEDEHRITLHVHQSGWELIRWRSAGQLMFVANTPEGQMLAVGANESEAKRNLVAQARKGGILLRGMDDGS
jgi:hypothetical protein